MILYVNHSGLWEVCSAPCVPPLIPLAPVILVRSLGARAGASGPILGLDALNRFGVCSDLSLGKGL